MSSDTDFLTVRHITRVFVQHKILSDEHITENLNNETNLKHYTSSLSEKEFPVVDKTKRLFNKEFLMMNKTNSRGMQKRKEGYVAG